MLIKDFDSLSALQSQADGYYITKGYHPSALQMTQNQYKKLCDFWSKDLKPTHFYGIPIIILKDDESRTWSNNG